MGIYRVLKLASTFETKIALASYEDLRNISRLALDLVHNSQYLIDASTDKEGVQDILDVLGSAARQLLIDAKTYGISAEGITTYKNYFNMLLAALGQRIAPSHYAFVKPLHHAVSSWSENPVYSRQPAPVETVSTPEEPEGAAYQAEREELPEEAYDVIYSLMEEDEPDPAAVGYPVEWKTY